MVLRAFLDLETFSAIPLKNGTFKYSEQSEILLFAYALEDEEVRVWDITSDDQMPGDLYKILYSEDIELWFHNVQFDRTIFESSVFGGSSWPVINPNRWRCTMTQAMCHGLPGSLDKLCEIFKLDADVAKDKRGKQLINMFCKPQPEKQKIRRKTRKTHPAEWAEFVDYAKSDIRAMRVLIDKMPKWNYPNHEFELKLWQMSNEMNREGVHVDLELAAKAIEATDLEQTRLGRQISETTNGEVERATQRDKLLEFILKEHGVSLPDMKGATLERLLGTDLPAGVRELLNIRLAASTSSVSKYKRVMDSTNNDGYLRGLIQFSGAGRTGRDAGRLFQPQNLMRPTLKNKEIENGIDAIKAGCVDLVTGNVMELCANAMRGVIIAPPGSKLVVADLSNIEGRVIAWLAGEDWKLQAFRDFDKGEGPDLYCASYGKAFGVDPSEIGRDDIRRQVGKTLELACLEGDTLVFTDIGLISLADVTEDMQLWDGESWVKHSGVAHMGVKETINLDGVGVTRDHLVLAGDKWEQAGFIASNGNAGIYARATGNRGLSDLLRSGWEHQFALAPERFSYTGGMKNVYDIANAGPNNRFMVMGSRSPMIVHNCGFGGGVGSFLTFATAFNLDLAKLTSGISLPADVEKECEKFWDWSIDTERSTYGLPKEVFVACDGLKRLWRRAHPNIVSLWARAQHNFEAATDNPDIVLKVGHCSFLRKGNWLRIILPSGRSLSYPSPRIDDKGKLSFMGINQFNRKWQRVNTYGGKTVENMTQAVARDAFKATYLDIVAAGYSLRLPVHDENITYAPDDARYNAFNLSGIMAMKIAWAEGLPLAAAGFEALRYRK